VRDAYPTAWLAGRAAAVRHLNVNTAAAIGRAEAERACSANLLYRPKAAAWWAGYATYVAERQALARRLKEDADRA
jgi:hypothetical protein